jgi:HAAS
MMSGQDPIESYLDRLVEVLRGPGKEVRRALAESEDHLREAEAGELASGRNSEAAAAAAITRFGTPEEVARRYDLMRRVATPGQIVAQAIMSLVLVGSIILISIGVSGLVAGVGAAGLGPEFIAGDQPGVAYTPERCADFLEFHPEATTCEAAAVAHHLDETVGYRLTAGVLGLILLAVWWLTKRGARGRFGPWAIPVSFVPIATTASFAAATVVLGLLGAGQLLTSGVDTGAGYMLSAAAVSLAATGMFGTWLIRTLRSPAG